MSKKPLDITGQRYGKLTAISRVGKGKSGHSRWLCKCDCGAEVTFFLTCIRSGASKSCGCAMSDNMKNLTRRLKNHRYRPVSWEVLDEEFLSS